MENPGQIAKSALGTVGPTIGSVLFNEAKLCVSLRDDLEKLKQIKVFLQWRLNNLEDKVLEHRLNGSIQGADRYLFQCGNEVMKTLKFVIYDIEDAVNEYYQSKRFKMKNCLDKVSSLFSMSNPIISRFYMIRNMNSIGDEIRRIQDLFFSIESLMSSVPKQINLYPRSSSPVIGRDEDFNKIMGLIKKDYDETIIVAIVAPSGFGKTSLVKQFYSDSEIKAKFKRIWMDFSICAIDLEGICQEIIIKSGKQILRDQPLNNQLKTVHHEDCFIVLDGLLGDQQLLAQLKELLTVGRSARSIIMVTTHSQKVAKMIATVNPYMLPPLSADVCCKIVQSTTRCVDDDELFVEHCDSIATRCNGMPLVAEFIGSVLGTGPEIPQMWKLAKDQELWKVEFDFCSAPPLLQNYRYIYYKMPQNMRSCFVYCSIFSKAIRIKRKNLTRQWLALGMIETGHNTLPLEVIADQYVEEMKALFLLEASEMEDSEMFHLNGLAYDLARSVSSTEIILLSEDCKDAHRYCDYRFMQLSAGILSSVDRKNWPVKARSLILKSSDSELKLLKQVISRNELLRVLDLRECSIIEIPSCVFHLDQLRYLDASGLPITKFLLPRNKLQKLETLDLSDTSLEGLPNCISDLKILSFLSLRGCQQLLCLPDNFGAFDKLQFLDLANCVRLQQVPESFEMLRAIDHLDLSGCHPSIIRDDTAVPVDLNSVGTGNASRSTGVAAELNATVVRTDILATENSPGMPETIIFPSAELNNQHKEIEELTDHNSSGRVLDPQMSCESSSNSISVTPLSDASAEVPNTASDVEQGDSENKSTMLVDSDRKTVTANDGLLLTANPSSCESTSSNSETDSS